MIGTTANYPAVREASIAGGAFLSETDVSTKALTIVLGANVAPELFADADPIGQFARIALAGGRITLRFRVVGVMAPRGGSNGGVEDSYVYVPVTSIQNRVGFLRNPTGDVVVTQIDVKSAPNANQELVKLQIADLLLQRHDVPTADFVVQSQDDLIGAASEVSNTLSILLGSIAGISLLVGGIGVMNIMLANIMERYSEIGLRRAIGARRKDIRSQFLIEAVVTCLLGGIVGLCVGLMISVSVAWLGGLPVAFAWGSMVLAFLLSTSVGVAFGLMPAIRAANISPIEALQHD
jgi:putative ABC transport system permease protein